MIEFSTVYVIVTIAIVSRNLCNCDTFDFQFQSTSERRGDLLDSLVSGVQLGLRNVMNNILPSVDTHSDTVNNKNDRFKVPDVTLPSILGGSRLIPLGCPKCKSVDTTKLFGTWRVIYASDNFIKTNMMALSKMSPQRDNPLDGSDSTTTKSSSLSEVFYPTRLPVCVKLQIGQPVSYGFIMDFPLQFAFKSGTPNGQLHVGYGNLRLFSDGKLILLAGNGAYSIKLCIIETNIQGSFPKETEPFPNELEPFARLHERFNVTSENGTETSSIDTVEIIKRLNKSDVINTKQITDNPYFIILSDPSGFPGCQNYIVLVNDELSYMKKYDRYVGEMLKQISADSDANPLQYLGCPCGFTAY